MTTTIIAIVFIALVVLWLVAMCKAASLGDEKDEEMANDEIQQ